VISPTTRPDCKVTAPGLLYLTEPARAVAEIAVLTSSAPLLAALPRGDGHPVPTLPGLGATDSSTATLRAVLRRLGYRTYGWRLGRNIGPTAWAVHGTRARLGQLTNRSGQLVSLIDWSLGGIYGRQLAGRTVPAVRKVITLGTPIRLARKVHRHADRLFRDYPYWHTETRDLPLKHREGLLSVPTTSIYSPLDGIVAWRACLNERGPHAENIAVTASHLGLGHPPAVILVVPGRLAQPAGQWAPSPAAVAAARGLPATSKAVMNVGSHL
jgi:hypothetical protein